jgi:hypothetical protein
MFHETSRRREVLEIVGHAYGERVKAALESNLSFSRWANCGSVCREFESPRTLTFKHHRQIAALPEMIGATRDMVRDVLGEIRKFQIPPKPGIYTEQRVTP